MSSGLQLDVRHHIQWTRHLVNAYEGHQNKVNVINWDIYRLFYVVDVSVYQLNRVTKD